MTFRRVVSIALTATIMTLGVSGIRPIGTLAAKDEIRGFSIFDHKGACEHAGDDTKATLDISDEDNLIWWIANSCKIAQEVRLCVYKKEDGSLYNPFRKCSPASRDVDTVFKVDSRTDVEVTCKGTQKGMFLKMIEVDTKISGAHCPDPIPSPRTSRTHVLDVEILP